MFENFPLERERLNTLFEKSGLEKDSASDNSNGE
jgi:hypothetical protein